MKEAAGEANMTVITIVLIGVVAAVGLLLVPRLMKNARKKACCTDAGNYVSGVYCVKPGTEGTPSATQYNMNDPKYENTWVAFKSCMGN